eukprot:1527780-Rhodomonas_salina.1
MAVGARRGSEFERADQCGAAGAALLRASPQPAPTAQRPVRSERASERAREGEKERRREEGWCRSDVGTHPFLKT